MSHKFLLLENIGRNSQKRCHMSWSLEMSQRGTYKLRGWHKERLEAKGCPGGPNDKGAFHEELVVPSKLSRATWKSLEGMKQNPFLPTLNLPICQFFVLDPRILLKTKNFFQLKILHRKQLDCFSNRASCNHLPTRHFREFSAIFLLQL